MVGFVVAGVGALSVAAAGDAVGTRGAVTDFGRGAFAGAGTIGRTLAMPGDVVRAGGAVP